MLTPEQFGFERCQKEDLQGGSPAENAEILKAVLRGEKGAKRNAAVLNAAAALFVSGKFESIESAVNVANEVIDDGQAYKKLEEFIRFSNEE